MSAGRFRKLKQRFERLRRDLVHGVRRRCPGLRRLYRSAPNQYRLTKGVIGFLLGALLGVGLHFAVIRRLRVPEFAQWGLSGVFAAGLAFGCATSIQVRCMALLILPTFCGKSGRSYVGTFALAFLLAGPIANLVLNASEVTRSIRCTIGVASNLTRSRMKLRFTPLRDIMKDIQKQALNIHNLTRQVKGKFLPIELEVEDDAEIEQLKADTDYVDSLQGSSSSRSRLLEDRHRKVRTNGPEEEKENNYERKLDYRCEDIFSIGVKNCRKAFAEAERRCMGKLSVAGHLFCQPLKLTVVCKLMNLVPGIIGINCNSMKAVNEGFGDAYQTALDAGNDLDENFKLNMQYKVVKTPEEVDQVTAEEVSKEVAYEFEQRQVWVNFTLDMINTFMTFLFMRVIVSSYKYHKKYVTDIKYDNIYVTAYFRRIDARRHKQGSRTLLPLKKMERKELINATGLKMTSVEVKKVVSRTVRLLVQVFIYLTVIIVDRVLYECLDIIQRHSSIDFKQTGSHEISLTVAGNGVMGQLMRTLLHGFNRKHTINDLASNADCLPQPTKTENIHMVKIGLVFTGLFVLVILEGYALRLRGLIACFFYPKREKKRTLFLYNDMLKKRAGFLSHTRHEVRRKARERQLRVETSLLTSLRQQYPRLCRCLRILKTGKRTCLICDEPERRDFIACQTPGCRFAYCKECWVDIRKWCYACRREEDWSLDSSLSDL